jgi:hypothetical protein
MPQYTIKLHTYDPDIVEAFERLRKNRKQAAFTHEALKHFISSGKSSQMIDLMTADQRACLPNAATTVKQQETIATDTLPDPAKRPVVSVGGAVRTNDLVLKKIFE